MKRIKRKTWLKRQMIRIAKHHKKYCEREKCNISLIALLELLNDAGIKLTEKELENFV